MLRIEQAPAEIWVLFVPSHFMIRFRRHAELILKALIEMPKSGCGSYEGSMLNELGAETRRCGHAAGQISDPERAGYCHIIWI